MAAPGPLWSTQQREWLQALGHDVLALAPDGDGMIEVTPAPAAMGERPVARPATVPAKSAAPLLRALARAAGRSEDDPALLAALPELATLRGNPAARRALWPRLRTLRRQARR